MNGKNIFKGLLLSAVTIAAFSVPDLSAATKTGTTNITIVLPDLVILHYFSDLTLSFEQYSQSVNEGTAGSYNVQWTGTTEGGNAMTTSSIKDVLPGIVSMTIPNAWAVRGLSPSGNARVEISVGEELLTSGNSRIRILSNNIEINDNAGHSGKSITTALDGIAATSATIGNVKMTLDFSETSLAGAHTGGSYMITATTL
jgi:flagellin-like hook-associated protein FlgL